MPARLLAVLCGCVAFAAAALAPAASSTAADAADRSAAPAESVVAEPAAGVAPRAAELVDDMTTQERAASVVMGHIPTTDPAAIAEYMSTGLGGFILMGANVPDAEDGTRAVTTALSKGVIPPLIAIDQEGGDVSRLPWDDLPAAAQLRSQTPEATAAVSAARAALVARAGANVNFGVIADTTDDTSSFIFGRVLGTDPESAAERVAAAVEAEEPLVAATVKHFPGHGAAAGDSHELIPRTTESLDAWRRTDAVPFSAGIEAGASLLMFGHLAFTAVDDAPASLSARWHEIARNELGFDGVIVTDDLGMLESTGVADYADPVANAVDAVAAGNDLVLTIAHSTPKTAGRIAAGIAAAVEDGELPEQRLREAAERVLALRLEIAARGTAMLPCSACDPVT